MLQWLRGIAAVSVMLFHVSLFFSLQRHLDGPAALFGWRFGRFGVVLFFVISGALMAGLATRGGAGRFLAHRAVRVFPIYWIAVAAATALLRAEGAHPGFDLRALMLIPGGRWNYPLGVEWTLPFEMTFYLVVTALMLLGAAPRLQLAALVWLAGIAAAGVFAPRLQLEWQFPTLFHLPLTDFSAGFAFGLLVPWLLRRAWLAVAASVVGAGLILASETYPPLTTWMLAIGCAGLVAGAMVPGMTGPRFGQPLVALGDWSFSLYLCHVPVALAVLHFAPDHLPALALWAATVLLAVCVAALFGRFDVALHRVLRRWVDRAAPPVRYAIGGAVSVAIVLGGIGVIRRWL